MTAIIETMTNIFLSVLSFRRTSSSSMLMKIGQNFGTKRILEVVTVHSQVCKKSNRKAKKKQVLTLFWYFMNVVVPVHSKAALK